MKTTMKFLSLLLCLELVLSPVRGTIFLSSVAYAACPAGQTFSADVNRCLTSDQVRAVNNAVNSCRSMTDETARRQCYSDNANNALDAKNPGEASTAFVNDEGGTTGWGIATSAAAISVPLLFLIKALADKKKRGSPCKPASLMLLYAGGASLVVGEVVSFFQHRKKLNELDEARAAWKVKEDSKSADDNKVIATNAQSEAFELLAKNEDSIGQVAKTKMITYGIATGLFAAGAIMGTIEAVQLKTAYAQLAVPQTAEAGQATIKRLTCGEDPQGNSTAKDGGTTGGTSGGTTGGTSGGTTGGTAGGTAGGTTGTNSGTYKSVTEESSRLNADGSFETHKRTEITETLPGGNTPGSGAPAGGGGGSGINANTVIGAGSAVVPALLGGASGSSTNGSSTPSSTTPTPPPSNTPQSCPAGQLWSTSQNMCIQDADTCDGENTNGCDQGYLDINELLNKNIKTKAAKNLQHARSYTEMMELLAEINSLQFENYSRDAYHSDSLLIDSFQNISFSEMIPKIVSFNLLSEAHAKDGTVRPNVSGVGRSVVDTSANNGGLKSANGIDKVVNTAEEGNIIGKGNLDGAKSQVKGIMNKAVYTPKGRLITNGLLGVWMGIMTAHMHKVMKVSQSRADLLRKMKGEFDTGGGIGSCTSADRDDPGKPACYCFTSDDKQNPARSKSKICKTTLATLNLGSDMPSLAPKVCVDETSGIDPSCSCRNRRGADGKNTCAKVGGNFNMMGLNAGTFKMISASAAPANDLFNGNASTGNFNPGTIGSNAARIKKVADNSLLKDKAATKMMKDLEKSLVASTAGFSSGGPGFSQGSSLSGMTPQQAAASLEKELKKNEDLSVTGPGAVSAGQTPSEEQPEFGMTEEQLAAQETEVAEVMGQDLDMGNNDINNSSNTNLFDVLSNRYQRSGMRRLFDEEGKTKAEKPAESDIAP